MPIAKSQMGEAIQAGVGKSTQGDAGAVLGGIFNVTCHDADGNLKWEEQFHNLVTSVGLQDLNTQYFKGSAYTAVWYLGLVTGPGSGTTFVAADTAASHAGWAENVSYSQATRPAVTFGTATTADPSIITNSVSPSIFSMNASATIAGAFLINNNTKSGTTGILFSEGDFTGGDKIVASGDTINVTYTFTADGV